MKRTAVISSDSPSLWNASQAPGWTSEESEVLRMAVMKFGFGHWKEIIEGAYLPGKTPAQLNLQAQRMIGQQSLAEFFDIHLDMNKVFNENSKKEGVRLCG